MAELQNIRFETDDSGIATVTIARPKALNALNAETLQELSIVVGRAEDEPEIRALLITGDGEKAFVAGADISRMPEMSVEDARRFSAEGSALFRRLETLPKPVLAAVNGFALGGGCELALACDFIYASQRAKFGQPEVNLGILAGFGGTQRLPRRVGQAMAMELLLSGRAINADEALRIGLANRVTSPENLLTEARACLTEILSRGPVAVALTKALVQQAADVDIETGLQAETEAFGQVFGTADAREGVAAFLEKRPAAFRGE